MATFWLEFLCQANYFLPPPLIIFRDFHFSPAKFPDESIFLLYLNYSKSGKFALNLTFELTFIKLNSPSHILHAIKMAQMRVEGNPWNRTNQNFKLDNRIKSCVVSCPTNSIIENQTPSFQIVLAPYCTVFLNNK